MRKAAERLCLLQPTLSYNLKRLETERGCKLFVRAHNRLALCLMARDTVRAVEGRHRRHGGDCGAIEREKVREAATLHVGCFSILASSFLMPQVAASFPETSFDVVNCMEDDLAIGLVYSADAPERVGRFAARG